MLQSEVVKCFIRSQMQPNIFAKIAILISVVAIVTILICIIDDMGYDSPIPFILVIALAVIVGGIAAFQEQFCTSFYDNGHEIKYQLTEAQYISLMSGISSIHSDQSKASEGITFSFTEDGKEKEFDKVILPENSVTTKGDSYEVTVKEYDAISKPIFETIPNKVCVIDKIQEKK